MRASRLHGALGFTAIALIASLWAGTVISELFLGEDAVVRIKTLIPFGLVVLIPAIAGLGASGLYLGKGWRTGRIAAKRRRMPMIVFNGIAVLAPSALYLSYKANVGQFDSAFYAVQLIELAFGAFNLALLGLSARDGLELARARRSARPATEQGGPQ